MDASAASSLSVCFSHFSLTRVIVGMCFSYIGDYPTFYHSCARTLPPIGDNPAPPPLTSRPLYPLCLSTLPPSHPFRSRHYPFHGCQMSMLCFCLCPGCAPLRVVPLQLLIFFLVASPRLGGKLTRKAGGYPAGCPGPRPAFCPKCYTDLREWLNS